MYRTPTSATPQGRPKQGQATAIPLALQEDIKYGKGEIKKFQKELREDVIERLSMCEMFLEAIKTVGQKIKEKEKR